MSEIFLSYAHEDRKRAKKLAKTLEAQGWTVWWDRKIIVGQTFDQVIEHELETAKCVVVLWSKHSVSSEWCKNEAASAAERGVLVPVMIDHIKLPLEFRRRQTADLTDWGNDPSHMGFQALCDGISAMITGKKPPQRVESPPSKIRLIDKNFSAIDRALISFPNDPDFHMLKGYAAKDVYQSSKRLLPMKKRREYLSIARKSFEKTLKINPKHAFAHNGLGNVFFFEGQFNAAIKQHNIAIKLTNGSYSAAKQDKKLVERVKSGKIPFDY